MGDQASEQHSFLFADLSGFTVLTEVHGDEEAADLVEEFVADRSHAGARGPEGQDG